MPVASSFSSDFFGVMCSNIKCHILFVYLLFVSNVHSSEELLHRFMDENELNYYFETNDRLNVPFYEVIDVKACEDENGTNHWNLRNRTMVLKLTVLGEPISLNMQINENLASPLMQVKSTNGENSFQISNGQHKDCHYIYKSASVSAAFSNCHSGIGDFVRNMTHSIKHHKEMLNLFVRLQDGIIMLSNATYELKSLKKRLKSILKLQTRLGNMISSDVGNMHIIKKASVPNSFIYDMAERTITNRYNIHFKYSG